MQLHLMAIHIKNRWHSENADRSLQEIAGALAFNAWRIAVDRAINLNGERFSYKNDRQRISVLEEYLYFQVHAVDRMVYKMLQENERRALIVQLILRLSELIQDNSLELLGAGNYRAAFIERMNQRSGEYAEFIFNDNEPSYPALRHLGYHIQQLMGGAEENRWIIDQVMEKDGNEVYRQIIKTLQGLIPNDS